MEKEKSIQYNDAVKSIREKLNGREYSLGLDLGVGSIGLAAVALTSRDF